MLQAPTKIMVVEDSLDFLTALLATLVLEPRVKVVAAVHTGMQALSTLAEAAPDLILLDYRLPDISGVEVARRIRQQNLKVKIAILTAYAEEFLSSGPLMTLLADTGVVDVIPKSGFTLARLRTLLN